MLHDTAVPLNDNITLNESPSEKEGKSTPRMSMKTSTRPSMKVPPKRKGNFGAAHCCV